MKQYQDLVCHVLENGVRKEDRTGVGTLAVFGYQMRFDLQKGFPCLTTKRLHLRSIIHELLWFLRGDTNTAYLNENGVRIWDEWADDDGELGPTYGQQWRAWPTSNGQAIDQIAAIERTIKENPDSRRLVVSAWNVAQIDRMALPPCHCLFQFFVADDRLSCQVYQRSCDVGLGVPFNIASYALLTLMLAQSCHLEPGELIWTGGDTHIYRNHIEALTEQLERPPHTLPQMHIKPRAQGILDYRYEDFTLVNYYPHPAIRMEVAV